MRISVLKGFGRIFPLLVLTMMHPVTAHACSACYGEPDSPVSKGLTWAISALIGVVLSVLGGVIAFFVHASRQAARLEHAEAEQALVPQN